jgi:hypothetical protein
MAVPREVLRLPRLRGLHDFPEQGAQGSASQALNVEFSRGGPGIRRGTQKMDTIEPEAGEEGQALIGKGVWSWRVTADRGFGKDLVVVGYMRLGAVGAGGGFIQVRTTGNLVLATFKLHEDRDNLNAAYDSDQLGEWRAISFAPAGGKEHSGATVLIIATDKPSSFDAPFDELGNPREDFQAGLWALHESSEEGSVNGFMLKPITPVDRTVRSPADDFGAFAEHDLSYWGNDTGFVGVVLTTADDDAGPYLGVDTLWKADPFLATVFANRQDQNSIGARYIVSYKSRVVAAGLWDDPSGTAMRFSNHGDFDPSPSPEPIPGFGDTSIVNALQGWPVDDYHTFNTPDATPITGLAVWRDFLLVFKRRAIVMCRFTGVQDFSEVQMFQGVGCVAPDSIQSVHRGGMDGVLFLADDGVYLFDGKPNYVSGPIQRTLRDAVGRDVSGSVSVHYPSLNQYWLGIKGGGGAKNLDVGGNAQTFFVMDYRTGDWSIHTFNASIDAMGAIPGIHGKDELTPVSLSRRVGSNDLNICHHAGPAGTDEIASDDGDPYMARYELQRFPYGRHQVRRWSFLRLDLDDAGGTQPLSVYWKMDNQDRAASNDGGQNTTTPAGGFENGPLFGALTFGNAKFAEDGFVSARIALHGGPARWFRWGVETEGDTNVADWHITSAEIDTRRKEGRR